jgi:hypothetical protein
MHSKQRRPTVSVPRVAAAAAAGCCALLAAASASAQSWNFAVTLDGKPIGEHRFVVTDDGGGQSDVLSDARYRVKVLGLTVYRYALHDEERWAGRCLVQMQSRADDDGKRTEVLGHTEGDAFVWQVHSDAAAVPTSRTTCPMSFAYWSPALATASALLDPGSGRLEPVKVGALPLGTIDVHGVPTQVRGLRIEGLKQPIDVWYRGDAWVGLDTTVDGHSLRYRLP